MASLPVSISRQRRELNWALEMFLIFEGPDGNVIEIQQQTLLMSRCLHASNA